MYDLLIKNARVIDGTGNPFYCADVGIIENKIAKIGQIDDSAKDIIDAKGLCLSPGFIDSHSHSDFNIMKDQVILHKLAQGITTEVCGECGITFAPISQKYLNIGIEFYRSQQLLLPDDYENYTTFGKFMDTIDKMELSINLGFLVGHGALRLAVMGLDNCKASLAYVGQMKELVNEAMESGALGMSSGLKYAPGIYADQEEIIQLCHVVARHGGVYESHIRYQGNRLEESILDTIQVSRDTEVTAIISHHKALGRQNWGKVHNTVKMIDDAVDRGLRIGHNVYPYIASSTLLMVTMPPSVLALGVEKILKSLQDSQFCKQLHTRIFTPTEEWDNDLLNAGYGSILILSAPNTPDAVGKTIQEYARARDLDCFDAYIELLIENKLNVYIVVFSISEDDMQFVMKDPYCMIGSDSNLKYGDTVAHPRSIGTFPRVLGRYVRELKVLTLSDAIRKMTSLTAQQYGIKNKGLIIEGYDADITLFDKDIITDQADFKNTMLPNLGIKYVIVNGKIAMKDNIYTGSKSGKLVRR